MTDLMVIDGFQVPDYVKQLAPVDNDFGQAGGLPTISTFTTSSFKIKNEDNEKVVAAPLPIVILGISPKGTANSRSYYKEQYVEGTITAPDCASSDGIAPDSGDFKQSATCATCPMAVFGSAPGERKGQACAQNKILYVVPANKLDSPVYQIRVAPTSLKNVAAYGKKLAAAGIHPASVITSLGLVPETESQKTYPILYLDLAGFLDQSDGLASIDRSASIEIQSLIVTPVSLPAPQPVAPVSQPDPGQAAAVAAFESTATPSQVQAPQQEPTGFETSATEPEDLDASGQPWDEKLHSSGNTKTTKGFWTKRRGATAQPVKSEPAPTESAPDLLSDALKEWG